MFYVSRNSCSKLFLPYRSNTVIWHSEPFSFRLIIANNRLYVAALLQVMSKWSTTCQIVTSNVSETSKFLDQITRCLQARLKLQFNESYWRIPWYVYICYQENTLVKICSSLDEPAATLATLPVELLVARTPNGNHNHFFLFGCNRNINLTELEESTVGEMKTK